MDRFEWTDGSLCQGESLVTQQTGVRLYDGNVKSKFDYGTLSLTTHRLIWRDRRDPTCKICLSLSLVVFIEDEPSGFNKSAKIIVHLNVPGASKPAGPVKGSPYHHIKLSFRDAGQREFFRSFTEMLKQKRWEQAQVPKAITPQGRHRAGIVGIERNIQQRQKDTDRNISVAFEDLSKLIEKAKEMVGLSKTIASKIKDKQGDITDDETVKFKSYLLSMGIPDPVTRDTHGSGTKYFVELAKQLSSVLEKPLQEMGGMMTLTDMYCRLNRARGMELLSPEDLLNACRLLDNLRLPVRFREFESGVMVIQLQSHSEEKWISQTSATVDEKGNITADELAQLLGVSVILAKERLLCTEKSGKLCRDETVEGLRFYPNLFLTKV